MELVVFDLDGTLLNGSSEVSAHTAETLRRLRERGIAYTVATGRTLHAARDLLQDQGFDRPHIYKNGVVIWQPAMGRYSHTNLLTQQEIKRVIDAFLALSVTPFIFTLEPGEHHAVYHPPLQHAVEEHLAALFAKDRGLEVLPAAQLPAAADITNISALGSAESIGQIRQLVEAEPHLVAYAGEAIEGDGWHWIDVHHADASKGWAVQHLRDELGASRVICFGDGDNDLSMFEIADESYAPDNADEAVRAAATAVIGHHDEDGISRFLRERFEL